MLKKYEWVLIAFESCGRRVSSKPRKKQTRMSHVEGAVKSWALKSKVWVTIFIAALFIIARTWKQPRCP